MPASPSLLLRPGLTLLDFLAPHLVVDPIRGNLGGARKGGVPRSRAAGRHRLRRRSASEVLSGSVTKVFGTQRVGIREINHPTATSRISPSTSRLETQANSTIIVHFIVGASALISPPTHADVPWAQPSGGTVAVTEASLRGGAAGRALLQGALRLAFLSRRPTVVHAVGLVFHGPCWCGARRKEVASKHMAFGRRDHRVTSLMHLVVLASTAEPPKKVLSCAPLPMGTSGRGGAAGPKWAESAMRRVTS